MTPQIPKNSIIDPTSIVGRRFRPLLTGASTGGDDPPKLGDGVSIGHFCIVGNGSEIGAGTIIDDMTRVETDVRIGARCLLIYNAIICADATIGDDSVVGGFIGERSVVGSRCRIFGSLVHAQRDRTHGWDDDGVEEPAPHIGDDVLVGFGAVVIGGVRIEDGATIAANAIVSRDVPRDATVMGVNQISARRR